MERSEPSIYATHFVADANEVGDLLDCRKMTSAAACPVTSDQKARLDVVMWCTNGGCSRDLPLPCLSKNSQRILRFQLSRFRALI